MGRYVVRRKEPCPYVAPPLCAGDDDGEVCVDGVLVGGGERLCKEGEDVTVGSAVGESVMVDIVVGVDDEAVLIAGAEVMIRRRRKVDDEGDNVGDAEGDNVTLLRGGVELPLLGQKSPAPTPSVGLQTWQDFWQI